jgi:hypothetical protein
MSAQITVTLPEEVFQRAEFWAQRAGRPVADLLADTITLSLAPLGAPPNSEKSVADWTDDEVQAAADAALPVAEDQLLSTLLHHQQAGILTAPEQAELTALMYQYQEALLRKARALREAVQGGCGSHRSHEWRLHPRARASRFPLRQACFPEQAGPKLFGNVLVFSEGDWGGEAVGCQVYLTPSLA